MVFWALLMFLIVLILAVVLLAAYLGGKLGILRSKVIYSDTEGTPGETLYSKTLNLVGKPDFLIKRGSMVIPVEVKTGSTPSKPYPNHEMQLLAYCLLVEENYGAAPTLGYLKYPGKEFPITYNKEAKNKVIQLVNEITENARSNEEFFCTHKEHNY
jgi:CRISPR-associated exonuclease Cas4